ncbi:MAG: HAD family hydrolase [Symploca sp. SIO1C4]|uniref:HAD family hydrolase n=1 Tax=Symploca sp. SIO1C4 TaxID=2607765 RepID=A0A6B3NBF5_9CYAN|nr:HAD family hydrolase [Symploca sp. SIO1C4]
MKEQLRFLIFDLDGVITSEKKYWNTARLTVWDLIAGENYLGLSNYFGGGSDVSSRLLQVGKTVIPDNFIYELKSRAINSNWDLTFFVAGLHLVGILSKFRQDYPDSYLDILNRNSIPVTAKLQQLGRLLPAQEYNYKLSHSIIKSFWEKTSSLTGSTVLEYLSSFTSKKLGASLPSFLESKGELWQLCYRNFQEWYEGKRGYSLPDDDTVLDLTSIDNSLKILHNSGRYSLAIATGRPRVEVIQPLGNLGVLSYFDQERIVTYDEVLEAESIVSLSYPNQKLGKPHPFVLLKAIHPEQNVDIFCTEEFQKKNRQYAAYIGDAASDVVAAKQAGCIAIGVLTGFDGGKYRENDEGKKQEKKYQMLADLGCDVILSSIVELPELLGVREELN